MKKILSTICFLLSSVSLWAGVGDRIDFGSMELDKAYRMEADFSDYVGRFEATTDGVLTVSSSSSGSFMSPYADEELTQMLNYDLVYSQGGAYYDLEVKQGQTYYFYTNFCMNASTVTLSMGDGQTLKVLETSPAEGETFQISGTGLITINFSKSVSVSGAYIQVGTEQRSVPVNIYTSMLSADVKNTVMDLINEGILQAGGEFQFCLTNVHAADNPSLLYGTDGNYTITYKCGSKPISLVSVQELADSTFLSFWAEGNEKAILRLTFDGELMPTEGREDEAVAIISYGDIDLNDYYQERLPYTVSGNELTVDFSGKFRRPKDMVPSGNLYNMINVKVAAVRGTDGAYAFTNSSGSLGAYGFSYPYIEVKADVISEFYPLPGASLNDVDEIEIWVTDYAMLQHEGLAFVTPTDSIFVTDFSVTPDEGFEGAYILLVKVPQEVKQAEGEVILCFRNLQSADGVDHSAALTAKYQVGVPDGVPTLHLPANTAKSIYDLKGIRRTQQPLSPGIYIRNGQKILKK